MKMTHKSNITAQMFFTLMMLFVVINAGAQNRQWDFTGDIVKINKENPPIYVQRVRIGPEESGLWGAIMSGGETLIEPKYNFISDFDSYGLAIAEREGKYGYINWKGEEITKFIYDKPRWYSKSWQFNKGRALVRIGQLFGYIDREGLEVIKPQYTFAFPFDNYGHASVYKGELHIDHSFEGNFIDFRKLKAGLIDTLGNYIIKPTRYIKINPGIGDHYIAYSDGFETCNILNSMGDVVSPDYKEVELFADKYYIVRKSSGAGVVDQKGKVILPPVYSGISPFLFRDGKIVFMTSSKSGGGQNLIHFIKEDGRLLTSKNYYFKEMHNDGGLYFKFWGGVVWLQVVVDEAGNCGYINREGEEVIPCQFDSAENFSPITKLAIVRNHSKKYGAIDTSGKLIIPFKYDRLDNCFIEGEKITGNIGGFINGITTFFDSQGREM